jgi:glycine/D-amino acid oxidase-like deaminating enzyme
LTSKPTDQHYDLAVVGAGIIGLAHALAAARRGKRVIVIDRDAQANGASIRNFGFVTVTGQQAGQCWQRAMRSRDIWEEVAQKAGIDVIHSGLVVAARRPEAVHVLEAFAATEMGRECRLMTPAVAQAIVPSLKASALAGALYSPHERRVESRHAIPKLAAWLQEAHGVTILRSTLVREVAPPRIETTAGTIHADAAVVCAGDDFRTLFPERIARYGVVTCKLHMMRVAPPAPAPRHIPGLAHRRRGAARVRGHGQGRAPEPLRSAAAYRGGADRRRPGRACPSRRSGPATSRPPGRPRFPPLPCHAERQRPEGCRAAPSERMVMASSPIPGHPARAVPRCPRPSMTGGR